uniref:Glycosyltransferases n=1 Tax=Brassica oleracea TaxID=3712 RepID=A0A3P6BDT6_BRAOL|nr:unnamed protein product [Brassica oleracea]
MEEKCISSWWMVDLGEDHQLMCSYYTFRRWVLEDSGINGWENMDGLENSTVTWNSRVTSVENYTAMKWPVDCVHNTREKTFIEQVVADESDMEGVPPACSRILNWHLHLAALDVPYPQGWVIQNNIKSFITVR